MPVPAKRRSRSKNRRVRAHHALTVKYLKKCPSCGQLTMPHRACLSCGYYKGREIVKPKVKKTKPTRKK